MLRLPALLLALVAAAPPAPAQVPAPYGDAVAARFPAPERRYDTPAFAPGREEFTRNHELTDFLAALADGERVHRIDLGRSPAGAPITALHFTRGPGRPTALLIGQQHGNEPAGAEALLAVAQALARAGSSLAEVLEAIDVVVLPRANPDGALLGRRGNAQNLDVNRDHLLLATPEARLIADLARRFEPVLVVDVHEHLALSRHWQAIGATARHDLLVQIATTPNLAPSIVRFSEEAFRQPLWRDLEREGLSVDWYYVRGAADGRLAMGGVQPALARNAYGLRHAVSVLLESRGMDLGRLHFERRVHSHVVAVTSLLRSTAANAGVLAGHRAEAAAEQARQACAGTLVVDAQPTPTRRELVLIDARTGADRPVTVDWDSSLQLRPVISRSRPCAYWLDAGAGDAVGRLRALGVAVRAIEAPQSLAVERYRETARGSAADPAAPLRLGVTLVAERLQAPAGSYLVPMNQPLSALAAAALEPDTAHSFVAHRLLTLAQLARVLEMP